MIHLDSDSLGTIAFVWAICALVLFIVLKFINNNWISIPLVVLAVVFMVFITYFFRVPNREIPEGDNIVTSVADGKVVIIEKVYEKEYLHKECMQVSVYMNFFDVHCNFWPLDGEITYYKYHPGKYLLAFHPKSSELNEHASTAIKVGEEEILFKQIAGTFARRIVCYAAYSGEAERGKQCGVIKFGSRIDMFLPLDADIKVHLGEEVRAVKTVIAELKPTENSIAEEN